MFEDGRVLGSRLLAGDLAAAPAVLNLLENSTAAARAQAAALLEVISADSAAAPRSHLIGVTGPPGVGKSTLLSRLAQAWRASGRSVAVLAVDPSSKRSGGALLGDRARIENDPHDRSLFIRSMAAGERLGGLAPATRGAAAALATCFDVVVIETVGVGQSETEVAEVVDTVAVVVQPGSGDVLQFLKSGIMEIPDVLVVTKADLGEIALRTQADLHAAMRSLATGKLPVLAVSSLAPVQGIEALVNALDAHRASLDLKEHRAGARRAHAIADFSTEFGERGLRALGGRRAAAQWLAEQDSEDSVPALIAALEARADRAR